MMMINEKMSSTCGWMLRPLHIHGVCGDFLHASAIPWISGKFFEKTVYEKGLKVAGETIAKVSKDNVYEDFLKGIIWEEGLNRICGLINTLNGVLRDKRNLRDAAKELVNIHKASVIKAQEKVRIIEVMFFYPIPRPTYPTSLESEATSFFKS